MTNPSAALRDRWATALCVLVVLVAVALRFVALDVWPFVQADEGLWTIGAKNAVSYGDWFLDGRTHFFLSPLFHLLTAGLFTVFEPGIAVARSLSAAAGVGTVVCTGLLVHRLKSDDVLTLTAVLVATLTEFSVLISRTALIESLQLFLLTLAVLCLLSRRTWVRTGGVALAVAMALLTKLNSGFIVVVAVVFIAWRAWEEDDPWEGVARAAPILIGVLLAVAVYAGLYHWKPGQFRSAFAFELEGAHFQAVTDPLFRIGRFAVDFGKIAETVVSLFREMPFVSVLGTVGFASRLGDRFRGDQVFAAWLVIGVGFALVQLYQPIRYLYLVFPALAYFASVTIVGVARTETAQAEQGAGLGGWSPRWLAVTGAFVLFETAYIAGGAIQNRSARLATVRAVSEQLPPESTIVGASYLCVDIEQKCLSHYEVVRGEEDTETAVLRRGADYVLVDASEWSAETSAAVAEAFEKIEDFSFGAVYRTDRQRKDGR